MKKQVLILLIAASASGVLAAEAHVDWRFGLEWNEAGLTWYDPHIERLLSKLEKLDTPGGINVNGVAAWKDMQAGPSEPISFRKMDDIVTVFQNHGFSLTPYLNCNALWACPSKNISQGEAAPDPEYEQHWIDFIKAVVERYDGDGVDDMEGLTIPIRYYVYTGEIVYPGSGKGDAEWGPYWSDTIDNLLRLHRITYQAINEADPTGKTKIVSAGAILFDLFADFPDYPACDSMDPGSTLRRRLEGNNYRGSTYSAGWDSLKKMLDSFGDDGDGIECDYIGWHPHISWRVIDQEFALIRRHTGDKPIYVDDMWTNISSLGYNFGASVPGFAQFNAPPWPPQNGEWAKKIYGDFPNSLFTGPDPHAALLTGLLNRNPEITGWYYARQAREIVKSFVSAFGEGAERACLSGTNDVPEAQNVLFGSIGWINFLGVRATGYPEKPGYYTYRLLIEKLHDFTSVEELRVSDDPRTRVYKFQRPGGPISVLWSETGDAPPDLDYRNNPTGEQITFSTGNGVDSLKLIHIITDAMSTVPQQRMIPVRNSRFTLKLGYEPVFIEGDIFPAATRIGSRAWGSTPAFELLQNYPNPFNLSTSIAFTIRARGRVSIRIYDLLGREIRRLVENEFEPGRHEIGWDGVDDAGRTVQTGIYVIRIESGNFSDTKKCLVLK